MISSEKEMSLPKKIKLNKISKSTKKVLTVTQKPVVKTNEKRERENGREQAFFDAAKSGNFKKITELIALCDPMETEHLKQGLLDTVKNSLTPLQIAAANGHVKCIQILTECGANVDAKDEFGCTALHLAAKSGNYMCLKILLKAGANCSIHIETSLHGKPPYFKDFKAPHIKGIERGSTALHLAVKYNHVDCVEELIKFGAECSAVDINGHTSLHIAAKTGLNQCVFILLKSNHCRTSLFLPSLVTLDTPLHYALENRMVECVKELVHLGSDVNHINKYGLSPIHVLLSKPKTDIDMQILKLLVLDGFNTDINKPTSEGHSPLYLALFHFFDLEIVSFLIAHGADINLIDIKPSLLEYLLLIPISHDILKCIMKSLPKLRRLKSLDVCFEYRGGDTIRLVKEETGIFVVVFGDDLKIINEKLEKQGWYISSDPIWKCIKFPLQQPVLDIIYERVNEKLQHFRENFIARTSISFFLSLYTKYESYLLALKEKLWYERIASNPLTLQHYCRFSIRKSMGPSVNMRHIKKLPLPEKLLSYLLFECDD